MTNYSHAHNELPINRLTKKSKAKSTFYKGTQHISNIMMKNVNRVQI